MLPTALSSPFDERHDGKRSDRRRPPDTLPTSCRDLLAILRSELPLTFAELKKSDIAPVDFAQAAIGSGMAIFTRYTRGPEADAGAVGVRN